MHSAEQEKWYLRQHGEAIGPFPALQIARYLLLGRLELDDEISLDTQRWYRLREVAEVQPDKLEGLPSLPENLREQLTATRLWIAQHPSLFSPSPQGVEEAVLLQQDYRPQTGLNGINRPMAYGLAALLGLGVILLALILPSAMSPEMPECEAPAAAGVNWSNCLLQGSNLDNADLRGAKLRNTLLGTSTFRGANLEGADLAYADLSLARMRGARLVGADLTGANLRNADLQAANLQDANLGYANLSGVELQGANLQGAKLGYAVWNEEYICMPESVGQCILGRRP